MNIEYRTVPVVVVSIDELRAPTNQSGDDVPFEYDLGLYSNTDTDTLGEIANIRRLADQRKLTAKDKKIIDLILEDEKLSASGRKAKERIIQKLRSLIAR